VSDTNGGRGAAAQAGQGVERSRVGKGANHIIGDLSTTLDGEPSEGKSGTLGWTKGDYEREGERERERQTVVLLYMHIKFSYYSVADSNMHVSTCISTVYY
jgi:hypothetical protein